MTEQIIEILKISSLIIFNLFFLIMIFIGLVGLRLGLKLNEMRKSISQDYEEISTAFKEKIDNIDEKTVEVVSGITSGVMHGMKRKRERNTTLGVAKKILSFFVK